MKIFKDCDKDGQFRVNQAKKESAGDLKWQFWGRWSQEKLKIVKKVCKHDELSEVPLKIVQKPGWQTDLNHPFIMKVKEVIARSEKSTTIVMEYVKRDESLI